MLVLVVDPDPDASATAAERLRAAGSDVVEVSGGAEAIASAGRLRFDFVILELSLADMDGVELIRLLRIGSSVPIIVCSSRTGRADKVCGLEAGADDFLGKPFGAGELLARMRAVERRSAARTGREQMVRIGRHDVDISERSVRDDGGRLVPLTSTQWAVLAALARRPGHTVERERILDEVWGPGFQSEPHYLRQYIAQLRGKLERDPHRPCHILTDAGTGYLLLL